MNKFTKLKDIKNEEKQAEIKYDSGNINVISYQDWEFIQEASCVVIIPYLKADACILLRHEPVPTYQYYYKDKTEYKDITHFLTCISGTIEPNETLINAVRRELVEETGIVLSDVYQLEKDKSVFMTKGNASMYHIFFLELNYNDYRLVQPMGDGSVHEQNSKTIKINLSDINSLKTHDLITEYVLTKFKLIYELK